jgi:hypothetical protein
MVARNHSPRSHSGQARAALVLAVALIACGPGSRNSPATRYQGILLNARKLGADVLASAAAGDPTLRDALALGGEPDFLIVLGPTDLEVIWAPASRLVHFRRVDPNAPSVAGMLTPLPSGLLGLLPRDLRAGTPARTGGLGTTCWHVLVGAEMCRTCCKTRQACVGECVPPG